MKTQIDVFRVSKAGNTSEENEDANWPQNANTTLRTSRARIAIADGATDSARSRIWSQLLVRDFGRGRLTSSSIEGRLATLAKVWRRAAHKPDLPWYAQAKMRLGAFAAFVGLEITEISSVGRWCTLACGDSIVFHMRSDEILRVVPQLRSQDFSNSPRLLGTPSKGRGLEAVETAEGEWLDGDCFYLMTDALACWYLTCYERNQDPWHQLVNRTFTQSPNFVEWIEALREQGQLKNDDCTLIIVTPELS